MANIILNVDLNSTNAKKSMQELVQIIEATATSLQKIPVNKDLTTQIQAITANYKELANAVKLTTKATRENEMHEAKLFTERERGRKATAQADLAEEKLNETRRKGTQETKDATNANKKHEKGVLDMAKGFLQWQAAATLVMQPLQKLRGLVNDLNDTLVETESAVITLTRVAGEEANSDDIYALAQKYGQSFENVSEVVERFAKSGYSWRDSISAAEEALIAMNVAELDAEQSTEGLISILKQYNLEIKDLATVNGILNKTADKYAVDTEELLFALQKTGSTARNAGLDLKETAGLITAISEGTAASGQNIGNALRSLFIFSSDKKALETFASLSESMAETVKLYKAGGASILDVWKGLGQELNRLENKKGMLSELFGGVDLDSDLAANLTQIEDQFAEIYGTAGNYRQNYFISLLDNIETATKAVEDMTDVEEYSHKENDLAMETYEKKLARLDAKWKELANDEQGILQLKKDVVDIGMGLLEWIDSIGGIKALINTTLAVLSPFLIKWTYVFAIKSIAATKAAFASLFATIKSGAIASNAALGVLGLALGAIAFAWSAISQAEEDATKGLTSYEEKAKSLDSDLVRKKTELDALDALVEKYGELNEKEDLNYLEKAKLASVVEKLSSVYTDVEFKLDSVTGKYSANTKEIYKNKDAILELYEAEVYGKKAVEAKFEAENLLSKHGYDNYETFLYDYFNIDANVDDVDFITFWVSRLTGEELSTDKLLKYQEIYNEYNRLMGIYEKYKGYIVNTDVGEGFGGGTGGSGGDNSSLSETLELYKDISEELDNIVNAKKEEETLAEKQNKILEEQVKLEEKRNKARQDAIVNALKAERDGEKENLSLEEKRLAVEKARKQLEDAKKQRSVRVIDVSTGLFTRVESQPAVEEAEENLANAVETLKEYIEDQAWDSVIEAVENGNTDLASIKELLKSTLGKYSEDIGLFGSLAIQTKIISAFKNGFNAPVDESGFSDGLDKAKKDYQEYQDNLLMADVKSILSSDKLITLGDAISLLDKYKGVASDGALKIARDALADATGHDGMYMGYFGSKYGGAIADKMEEFANSIFGGNIFDTSGMEQYFSQNGVLHGTPQTHNNGSPIYQNSTVNNNQSQSYSINGVPIPAQAAAEMSIAEFCRTVPLMIGFGH